VSELAEAEERFMLLVPIRSKQVMYRRLFKWVVAQAVWQYSKPTDEQANKTIAGYLEYAYACCGRYCWVTEGLT
jgi:hypothetical protein